MRSRILATIGTWQTHASNLRDDANSGSPEDKRHVLGKVDAFEAATLDLAAVIDMDR